MSWDTKTEERLRKSLEADEVVTIERSSRTGEIDVQGDIEDALDEIERLEAERDDVMRSYQEVGAQLGEERERADRLEAELFSEQAKAVERGQKLIMLQSQSEQRIATLTRERDAARDAVFAPGGWDDLCRAAERDAQAQRKRLARWKAVAKSLRCAFENGYARIRGSREIGHLWSAHENIRRMMDDVETLLSLNAEQRVRIKTLEAALQDERRLLRRKLGEVEHHETRAGLNNVWVNAFAAAHLPDWEIRQRLEAIDNALAAQEVKP